MFHPVAIVRGVLEERIDSYEGPTGALLNSQEFYETDRARGFLRGEGDLPWWSVCLSIVATETATINTTATLPFRGIGLDVDPPGAPGTAAGAYNNVIVAFNSVATKQLTGI